MEYINCKFCQHPYQDHFVGLSIVTCENCKLIFCKKQFSQDELAQTYNNLYNKNTSSHYKVHTEYEFNKLEKGVLPRIGYNRKKILKKYCNNSSLKVLEIGSGVGLIGSYLKEKKILNYTGLELDTETCEKAKSLGLNVINADFSYMKNLTNNFNVVMLWEVMEHLQDLRSFLELSHEKLEQGGMLIFSVPNFNKIKNYSTPSSGIYQDGPPIHLNFFTSENIYSILEMIGYKVSYHYVKKRPYLNFRDKHFYKMLWKSIIGKYEGSTMYVVAKKL